MKRRTGLLFSSAVVLGLVGGTVGGFLIQRARSATPLPPFQQTLAAAAGSGIADPRDATTDDGAKLDGDLRAVLLAKPAGAKDMTGFAPREWFTIGDLAEYYRNPSSALMKLNAEGFRRAARTGWTLADGTYVEIDLVQFRTVAGAKLFSASTNFPVDTTLPAIAGTATGAVGSPGDKDSSGMYAAYGLVRHGELVEQVFVNRAKSAPSTDEVAAVTRDQAGLL
ncbi:hypothetical protein [Catenulispora rubra]|uniref:hypothetical protein n=1 Tax=Catenulispora rubra TaxID=280293 RepID=UPI0018921B22|nr:hypothetical protein [Catenulispora rubra]